MTEKRFKQRLFTFLLGSKLFILLYLVLFLFPGMAFAERWASVALLMPLLAAYLIPLWEEAVENRHVKESSQGDPSPKLKKQFVRVCYLAFPLYIITIISVLTMFVTGALFGGEGASFGDTQPDRSGRLAAALAGIESAFGLYLGPVIVALSKSTSKKANPLFAKALQYVQEGKLNAALELVATESEELTLLAAQHAANEASIHAGTISHEDALLTENRILKALIAALTKDSKA